MKHVALLFASMGVFSMAGGALYVVWSDKDIDPAGSLVLSGLIFVCLACVGMAAEAGQKK